MDCEKIKELLSRYIDDQLEKDDRAQVEEHLKSCEQCTEHYEKLLALGRMVDEFDVDGDESYWVKQKDAVLEKIEKLEEEKVIPVTRNYRNLIYKLAAVAASVALLAFISIHELEKIHPSRGIF
ncbi:MAG: zf-HC2 domain-containing protein, partial [Candidatus Zixiibacteriota bacterium]